MTDKEKKIDTAVKVEKTVKAKVMKPVHERTAMSNDEFFSISRQLEDMHSLFYKFWEVGQPYFTDEVPTAGVTFDPRSGCYISFLFNPKFWKELSDYGRVFVIAHEMVHLILNHGVRGRDCKNHMMANVVMDLVDNDILFKKFKFNVKKVKIAKELVSMETLFTKNPYYSGPKPLPDKSFEYYYNLAKKGFPTITVKIPGKGKGQGGGKGTGQGQGDGSGDKDEKEQGEGQVPDTLDDHEGLTSEEAEELLKEMNDVLTDEEKDDIKEMVERHFQDEKNAPEKAEGDEAGGSESGEPGGKQAGKTAGNIWTFANINARLVRKKRKWETVIKKWAMMKVKPTFRDVEQWARVNRRFSICGDGQLMIPTEMEIDDRGMEEDKIEVWFMQDTSGSCAHLKDRFFKAAASLPDDKFKVRMFCFDTQVYETSLESGKLYGFGGTSFSCIETKIQEIIKKERIPYPSCVWIVSDGYADQVSPEHPEKWYFFLSEDYRHCIPKESKVHLLSDYE